MRSSTKATMSLACLMLLSAAAPCLWDYDTLQQERARFPSSLELITGKFPRHSEAYYHWRIENRQLRIETGEDGPEMFDDLAVAFSKLGDDARAIQIMADKEKRYPGLYETVANLGTFHLHAGDLEEGIAHIARAVEMNPDAHFGREIYQELLARYILERRGESDTLALPMQPEAVPAFTKGPANFWTFVQKSRAVTKENMEAEIAAASKGVLGMMRFGNYASPVLLEALSDVLLADMKTDAKRLAARALLKASYETQDEKASAAYRAKADMALNTQTPRPNEPANIQLEEVEKTFQTELADARHWWKTIEAKERYWIDSGDDVDARFGEAFFAKTPTINDESAGRYRMVERFGGVAVGALVVVAAGYVFIHMKRA